MEESEKKISQILIEIRLISEELLKKAEQQQKKTGGRLTESLVTLGVDAAAIRKALADRLNLSEVALRGRAIDPEATRLIP